VGPRHPSPRRPRQRAGRRGRRALKAHRIVLAGIVAGSAALLALGTTRVKEWTVMTDELLYAKLAQHFADTGSPLPVLHGEHAGFLGVVYSYLLAPFYAALDPVAAFDGAHVLNSVLFASAAIPIYLLARRVVPPECALVVAALSVAIPWAVNTATVMSESAAYPAFAWAVLACHLALSEPSPRHDLLAIGGLALAFFTRPQFLVLAAVLPLAALVVDGPRQALRRHRVLAGAILVALVVVLPLAALGEAHRLLGDYGVTATEGSLLPRGVWKAAAIHLDVVAVGLGVIPFLLGTAWTYSHLRGGPVPARAFATFTGIALPLLALETASYDLRFGGEGVIRGRYLFYIAPLLFTATAAALVGRLPVWGLVGASAFFAATVAFADFHRFPGIYLDSAESVLNGVIRDQSPGLPPGVFVALCGVVIGAVCLAFVGLPRPAVMLGVTVIVFAFCASTTGYVFERLLSSNAASGFPVTGKDRARNWVDGVADGRTVALLPYSVSRDWGQSAVTWWDAEFWNNTIEPTYVGSNGRFTYAPFPSRVLRIGPDGVVAGTEHAPKLVLAALTDSRFGFAGTRLAANVGMTLDKLTRPWRATWLSKGLYPDGWIRPGRPASIRVFAEHGNPTEKVKLAVTLDSPPEAQRSVSYRVGTATGSLAPSVRAVAETKVCVPAGGHADVPVQSEQTAVIAGPPFGPKPGPERKVGLIVSGASVEHTGNPCRP
jgi:hypothetical protein